MKRVALLALMVVVSCEGPRGPRGLPGRDTPLPDAEPAPDDAGSELDAASPAPEDAANPDDSAAVDAAFTGIVRDPSGVLERGSVVLIPKQRVVELTRQPLDLSQPAAALASASNDEPLEDA